jgi:hypothetical protein
MTKQRLLIPHRGDDVNFGEISFKSMVETKTADYTVLAEDSGKLFLANGSGTITFTLPSTALGLVYSFLVMQLPGSGVGTSVSPAAADKIIGNGFTAADDKDAINTAATDALGDMLELTGDGVDGWYVTLVKGTWAREA